MKVLENGTTPRYTGATTKSISSEGAARKHVRNMPAKRTERERRDDRSHRFRMRFAPTILRPFEHANSQE